MATEYGLSGTRHTPPISLHKLPRQQRRLLMCMRARAFVALLSLSLAPCALAAGPQFPRVGAAPCPLAISTADDWRIAEQGELLSRPVRLRAGAPGAARIELAEGSLWLAADSELA